MHTPSAPDPLFVVINPISGSCDPARVRATLERECAAVGCGCEFYFTTGKERLPEVVRVARQRGFALIVAAGGDGTASAVASALTDGAVPLGILPVGTANLLARELGIPMELADACRLLARGGRLRAVDAMQVGDTAYISHVSIGVYSSIAEKTSPAAKRLFRQLAYLWNALPALLGRRSWRFEIITDGQRQRVRASSIMIANVGTFGAADLRWGPNIQPDDGRIDICIIKARSIKHYLSLAWHMLTRRHKQSRLARYLSATRTIKVHSRKRRLPVRGDGEIVGHGGVSIRILPGAVKILVPKPPDA